MEKQFGQYTIASLNYVGAESHRLDVGGYYNTGTPSTTSFASREAYDFANPGANETGQPFPYAIPNRYDRSFGSGDYNGLQASLVQRSAYGLTYNLAYTWSKVIDEGASEWFGAGGTSGATGASLQNPYDLKGSRSVAGFNLPQVLTLGLTYEIPVGKGKTFTTGNPITDYILGNWDLGGLWLMRSGQVFSVTSAGDIANIGQAGTDQERADLTGNPKLSSGMRSKAEWFNTAAFSTPASGTFGNAGRNILQAQTYDQLDTSIYRSFPVWENLHFLLRADWFNVLNHPVLGLPGTVTTSASSFGVITSTANNQRLMQLSAKIVF